MPKRRPDPDVDQDAERDGFLTDPFALPELWEDWGPFGGVDDARRYWERHGERLTEAFRAERPGRRPWPWWRWSAPAGTGQHEPRATVVVLDDWTGRMLAPETLNLHVCGALTDAERAHVEKDGPVPWAELAAALPETA